jgi:hypothetical protein
MTVASVVGAQGLRHALLGGFHPPLLWVLSNLDDPNDTMQVIGHNDKFVFMYANFFANAS